jgi:metal-responsive CopG/Arc/MetJ family transcriptional regulator
MDRYSLFLPADLKRGLERLKQRDGISESEAIRRALAEFLRRRKIPIGTSQKGGKRTRQSK